MEKILITLCARGGSKGIPGKNIKLLNGKPLIAYSIEIAHKFKEHVQGVDITLSTDADEILNTARLFGLETDYKRPDYLANDTCGKVDAIKDVLLFNEVRLSKQYDYILDLDITSPLRTLDDLMSAFKQMKDCEEALTLFSVSPAHRNPYFNMVERGEDGYCSLVKSAGDSILSRQKAPLVYDLNASFYFYRRLFFDLDTNTVITPKSLAYVVPHTCFDLDEPDDFEYLSYLLRNNKINFIE